MKKFLSFVLALCMICTLLPAGILTTPVEAAAYAGTFEKYTGTLTEGYYLITYESYAMKATVSSNRLSNGSITDGAASVTNPDASIVWKIEKDGNYFTLYNESVSVYAAGNGTKNQAKLESSVTDNSKWTVTGTSTYEFVNLGNSNKGVNANLRNNTTYGFACYSTSTGGGLTLYKLKDTSTPEEPDEPDTPDTPDDSKGSYVLADVSTLKDTDKVVIVATKSSGTFAMPNNNGTGSAPSAVAVTVSDGVITSAVEEKLLWNISVDGSNITIYPNGTTATWLYCTATNNGVRVGTNTNKTFTIDAASGYLKHTGTSRYLGVYNTQDWRCYTSSTATNIAGQTFAFYKYVEAGTVDPDVPECGHTNTEEFGAVAATCTEAGKKAGLKCSDCGETITEPTTIDALGHKYVEGLCERCGEEEPQAPEMKTYTFADYAAGTQYAQNEVHKLDDIVTVTTTQSHFTSELRIYSSSTHNGYAIIQSKLPITAITVNAGNNADTLDVYGSNDGKEWTLIQGVSVASSYEDYTVKFSTNYTQLKLDVAGTKQVRVKSMTLTFASASAAEPVVEYIPVEGESVKYTTWEEALENAVAGELKLQTDLEIDQIDLENSDLVLDLNGKTLTVNAIVATVKDSADGKGLIDTASAILSAAGDQLILWDNNAKGYRVYDCGFASKGIDADGTDEEQTANSGGLVKSFWSDLDFVNADAYPRVANSGLEIGFKLEWNGEEVSFELNNAATMEEWGTEKANNDQTDIDYYFYITVTGFAGLKENGTLKVTPFVVDSLGNTVEAAAIPFEYTAE